MGKVMAAAKARFAGRAEMGAGLGGREGGARALTPIVRTNVDHEPHALPSSLVADVSVAPQLAPEAMAEAAAAGFRSVINNRPDFEGGPDQPTSRAIEAAARAAGLEYAWLPVAPGFQSADEIARFARAAGDAAQADPGVLPLGHALGQALQRRDRAADADASARRARARLLC